MLITVLLPAPFGPRKLKISPFFHRETDIVDRLEIPVAMFEVLDTDDRRFRVRMFHTVNIPRIRI